MADAAAAAQGMHNTPKEVSALNTNVCASWKVRTQTYEFHDYDGRELAHAKII